MFRAIVLLILFSATNAAAQYNCSPASWENAEGAYGAGQAKHSHMTQRYKTLCKKNPDCIHYESKDKEINELRSIKDEALQQYQAARDQFEWFTENCSFKYKFSAKSKLNSVSSNIRQLNKDFQDMQEDCLRIANKIANSYKCK